MMPLSAALLRTIANRITPEMLTKPVTDLTDLEVQMIQITLEGPHADELMARIDALGGAGESG